SLVRAGPSTLDDDCDGFSPTDAQRGKAPMLAARLHRMKERSEYPRAGRTDGVAERHGAAVDVDPRRVEPHEPRACHGHAGERLVDLPEVDVVRFQAKPLERSANRLGGRRRKPLWSLSCGAVAHDSTKRLQASPL